MSSSLPPGVGSVTGAPVSGVLVGSGDSERKDKAGEEMIGSVFGFF